MSIPQVKASVSNKVPERMKRLDKGMKYSLGKQLMESCKQLLRTIIAHTPPFEGKQGTGGTEQADKSGMKREERFIRSAFMPLSSEKFGNLIMARNDKALWNYENIVWREANCEDAWNERNMDKLYAIFQAAGWPAQENNTPYFSDVTEAQLGAILSTQGAAKDASAHNPSVRAYVKNRAVIEKMVAFKQKTVGVVNAGWKACLSQLGGVVAGKQAASTGSVEKKGVETEVVQHVVIKNNAMKSPAIVASYESSMTEEQKKKLTELRSAFKNQTTADFRRTVRKLCAKESQVGMGGTIKVDPDWVKKWCI